MAANKVTYNVGTSNKFAGFYDEGDLDGFPAHPAAGSAGVLRDPQAPAAPSLRVPYGAAAPEPREDAPNDAEDVYDSRARGRRMNRRFRGNPNSARKFDRVSGTGRGRELKKQGEGGHNWGNAARESKSPLAKTPEELAQELGNLSLGEGEPGARDREGSREAPERAEQGRVDMMDFESYKLLQQSRRSNLPTFTVNEKKSVSTDAELQSGGYVKYVKRTEEARAQEKVKVLNSQAASNPANLLPSHPSSFRDRRQRRLPAQPKPKSTAGRIRVKAPDLADLKLFPCLDLKS